VSHVRDGWDDEQLLGALREAMRAREAVPPGLIEAAKGAYAWHNIDAELAQLTYDSSRDEDRSAAVRSETASIRALTFTSAHTSIELEVTGDSLLGQVMPPGEGTIEAQTQEGVTTAAAVDEIGCFSIEPIPSGPFRLRCRTALGTDVMTGWITL
jgi:hypothetical protein